VLAGLLLGGALAHFFGGSKNAPPVAAVETSSPLPTVTPGSSIAPVRRFTPVPTASPSATPSPHPRPSEAATSVTALATPTPAVTIAPTVAPTRSPAPAAAPKATAPPKPADDRASAIVRAYLVALAGNDRATASTYLARGSPTETFMTENAHIESIRSVRAGPQQYRVGADVQTSSGEYYVTFTVEAGPAGLQISDHYTVKPQ